MAAAKRAKMGEHAFVENRPGDVATVPVHQEHPFGNAPFAIAAFETVEIAAAEEELVRNAGDFVPIELRGIAGAERVLHLCAIALQHAIGDQLAFADRKSDVTGKSVSVRVDLGGSRIIKKKKER